jgi:hypothetical protein
MSRRPARPSAALAAEVTRLRALWDDPEFQRDNRALLREALIARIGRAPTPEWDAFVKSWFHPFVQKWGAVPAMDVELADLVVFAAQWGAVPIFPWTTNAEIGAAARRIRQHIGKRPRDARTHDRVRLSRWLETNFIPRREIPRLLGWREDGASRPTVAEAVARGSFDEEQASMRPLLKSGLSYQAAERRMLRRRRGSEARAAVMMRKAQRRYEAWHRALVAAVEAPKVVEPISFALTGILRARYLTRDLSELTGAIAACHEALRDAAGAPRGRARRPQT